MDEVLGNCTVGRESGIGEIGIIMIQLGYDFCTGGV